MNDDQHDFERFLKRREEAASAYVTGDAEPLRGVAASTLPATFFGPGGGYRQGAEEVFSTYAKDVAIFEPGGDSHFEILQMAASDGVAYWVGFQHATARLKGKTEAVPMKLRGDGVVPPRRRRLEAGPSPRRHAGVRGGGEEEAVERLSNLCRGGPAWPPCSREAPTQGGHIGPPLRKARSGSGDQQLQLVVGRVPQWLRQVVRALLQFVTQGFRTVQ
jgi:hypothetical protein